MVRLLFLKHYKNILVLKLLAKIYLLFSLVVLSSCSFNKEEQKEVQTMISDLNQVTSILNEISLDSLKLNHQRILDTTKELERTLNPEAVDKEDNIFTLSDYRFMKKPYKKMISAYLDIEKSVAFRHKQLLDLEYFVRKNKFKTVEEMNAAILDERNRLRALIDYAKKLEQDHQKNSKRLNSLQTKIDIIKSKVAS